jgi:hypothetical protein
VSEKIAQTKQVEDGKPASFIGRAPKTISAFLTVVSAIGAAVSILFGILAFVDSRVKASIEEPSFISKLSRQLRPSVIFDEKSSVLADLGAMQHISDIRVATKADGAVEVVVSPVEPFGIEPVLESLDETFVIKAERGNKYDWVFHLYPVQTLLVAEVPKVERRRFRLELIR